MTTTLVPNPLVGAGPTHVLFLDAPSGDTEALVAKTADESAAAKLREVQPSLTARQFPISISNRFCF